MQELVPDVLAAVGRQLPVEADAWRPPVQGAVGHVTGVSGRDGTPYVLKTYPGHLGGRAATEVDALRRLGELPGVPVPAVVLTGELPGPGPVSYVLMARLPGARWGDRRPALAPAETTALTADVGRALRRLHQLPGERYGPLGSDGPSWASAWERVAARCDALVTADLAAGGPAGLTDRVRRFVERSRPAVETCGRPVLCHRDPSAGNILVTEDGAPRVCGIVDLERASWDDPLCDLALTRLHLRRHGGEEPEVLARAYGVRGAAEEARVDVHEVLHALEERTWISCDRPAGWAGSVAALEDFLRRRT